MINCYSWLFIEVESSYRNWLLLASDVEAWVGVDVLTSGGGVFYNLGLWFELKFVF